jgi:ferrochelatase
MPKPQNNGDYDALLLLSFGGPEGPHDVMPFLRKVTEGKNVPEERLREVARHYELFNGVSPLNSQNRALLAALVAELNARSPHWPVYWGNLFWHPLLEDTVEQMAADGVRRALAFVPSPFGSPPGCRRYVEEIERARQAVGPQAPKIHKLRLFYNHPGFIEPLAERTAAAWNNIPPERRETARLIFTAHSLPVDMAACSPYVRQLLEACRLVVSQIDKCVLGATAGLSSSACAWDTGGQATRGTHKILHDKPQDTGWELAYQSRSGRPDSPWLEPDVRDLIRRLRADDGLSDVVIVPLGFPAENMEVVYDLDVALGGLCEELGVNMVRAAVVGGHPRFVSMIRELIEERLDSSAPRLAWGSDGPSPDYCSADCCRAE